MNATFKPSPTMMPVSGRIPDDLYQWLSTASVDGATTVSDKLRVAVATLKRLQEGDADYNGALSMHRDLCHNTRRQLAAIEPKQGHSEVLSTVLEHAPAIAAAITSAQINTVADAKKLEDLLTQRCLQLAESLLRQAVTRDARAYDGQVVRRHATHLIELAALVQNHTTAA
jgi:hypothetical protein